MNPANTYSAYHWYLRSSWWKERRKHILERAKFKCEQCHSRKATEVHHLNYLHVFNELPTDLVALCRHCHRNIHHLTPANDNQLELSFPVTVRR